MRFDHLKSFYLAGAVFVLLVACGLWLSRHKLLWIDELYTQHLVIDGKSYAGILAVDFPEGNKAPLFYLVQKITCDFSSYHLPAGCDHTLIRVRDIPGQIILRLPSVGYMSLALALIFYFFLRFFSFGAAVFALAVALVSPMVWRYWAEARPYSLWFLLTTVQMLQLWLMVKHPYPKAARNLAWTHVLLALTAPASLFQILIGTLFAWWKKGCAFKQLAGVWLMPTAIAFFYYFLSTFIRAKTYMFLSNLFDVVMPERLCVYILYALYAWVLPKEYRTVSWNVFFLPVFILFFGSVVFLLAMDAFTQNSTQGIFSRYVIYLTPVDILMFTLASIDIFRWSRAHFWICFNASILLGGLVIVRGLMTYRDILATALYLHSS
jgi:hypothetical protein